MINVYGLALKEIINILSWQFLNPLKLGLFYFLIKIVSLKAFLSLGRTFIFLAPGKVKTMDERANTIRIHRENLPSKNNTIACSQQTIRNLSEIT